MDSALFCILVLGFAYFFVHTGFRVCIYMQNNMQNMQNNMQKNSALSIFCIFCVLLYAKYAEYDKGIFLHIVLHIFFAYCCIFSYVFCIVSCIFLHVIFIFCIYMQNMVRFVHLSGVSRGFNEISAKL